MSRLLPATPYQSEHRPTSTTCIISPFRPSLLRLSIQLEEMTLNSSALLCSAHTLTREKPFSSFYFEKTGFKLRPVFHRKTSFHLSLSLTNSIFDHSFILTKKLFGSDQQNHSVRMDYHWSPRRAGPEQQNARLPPATRKPSVEVTLFDIEKDGDPRIFWYMYYDFIVTKNEAYFQLQPGYLPTESFPRRRKSEPVLMSVSLLSP